jgi:DNA segregation ATPase FtsK/SpoIIIE-like protein
MKQNPYVLMIGGRNGISPKKMHEYAKKVLEAERIPYFEFDYDVLIDEAPARDREHDYYDELYEPAKQLVVMQQNAVVSFLQSRLQIGYRRAHLLMDKLERERELFPVLMDQRQERCFMRKMKKAVFERKEEITRIKAEIKVNKDLEGFEIYVCNGFETL